jgi:nucleoside-diphosphate-sugar epimerase
MLKCLITGATGLIGTKVLQKLQQQYEVYSILHNEKERNISLENVRYIIQDLSSPLDLRHLPSELDVVIHLAQSEHFRDFPEKAVEVFNVNTLSTLHLLDYARNAGVKKFIYASSGGIYGTGEHGFREEDKIVASSDLGFYLGTKLSSEIILKNYSGLMNIVILRFFFVYGPGQRRSMLIPRLVESIKNGIPVKLQGMDGVKINPTFVDDAATSVIKAILLDGSHLINVAGPSVYSLRQISTIIGNYLNKEPLYEIDEVNIPSHLLANIDNMSKYLHIPAVSFEEGVQSVINEMRG